MARKKKVPPATLSMPFFPDYLALPGCNWSSLKHMIKSPLHYQHALTEKKDTSAMRAGRAGHAACLEPDRFPIDFAVFLGARRAGAEWDQFAGANAGRTILKVAEYDEALAVRDAVRGHKVASRLLSGGRPEQTLTWVDPETGIACKGRIDYLRPDGLVDLKTTASLDPRRFASTANDMGYHGQLAFYARGLKALGMTDPGCWLVAVEGDAPHDVVAYRVDPGVLALGDELVGRMLNRLAECQATKRWPGRAGLEQTFYLPVWAYVTQEQAGADDLGITINGSSEAA